MCREIYSRTARRVFEKEGHISIKSKTSTKRNVGILIEIIAFQMLVIILILLLQ